MLLNRVGTLTQKRYASGGSGIFGNLGETITSIVPKAHSYFKVTKPFGFENPPIHLKDIPKKPWLTKQNLNFPKRIWDFYFDGVTRKTRVAKIQKDLAYGGLYDFHVYMRTKGRLFEAPISYFKRERSKYFPNFKVKSLTGSNVELMDVLSKSKISILRVYATESGLEMTDDYLKIPNSQDNYLSEQGLSLLKQEYPNTQIVELVLSENWSKHFIHTFITPSKLRSQIPKVQHSNYLIAMRDQVLPRSDRDQILMSNTYAGYIYLIDESFKIRWVGCGLPEPKEVKGLWKAVKGLERETNLRTARTTKKEVSK
ncbi:hypothetical protein CANARDRAFT_6127 [[Candida] arabinofermentans NRRL YB-2248]|uniref:Mitochondrial ATPase complex subunit ATP10 n=1 Tax=[Candida] arabinofermentans NRRL YB-2248 TaxID=983967 RepID=A0A1E4T778_9ASCO|nr:hypothetical protein CANARDRAFT_6127 [[Candida] arabinofermentans NRRL YB-2248]